MHCCVVAEERLSTYQSKFYCCGVVPKTVKSSSHCKIRHGMLWCNQHEEGVELGQEADENENTLPAVNVINPTVPYNGPLPDLLYVGSTIDINGKIHDNAQRFAVNLLTSHDDACDIGFHFNPRFDRRVVIRNTRRKESWGEEEIAAGRHFPFEKGRGTRLTLFVADGQFNVAVNAIHFCTFAFRIPVERIVALEINGDITLNQVRYRNSIVYPPPISSKTPFVLLPKSRRGTRVKIKRKTDIIKPGSSVEIDGHVNLLPQSFYLNLQIGRYTVPHPIIPFHMNLRLCQDSLLEEQVIYNAWIDGAWGQEVKPDSCPFSPGSTFHIQILYFMEGFHVTVNGQFANSFPLRLPVPIDIDTVLVDGDVTINKVKIKPLKVNSVSAWK